MMKNTRRALLVGLAFVAATLSAQEQWVRRYGLEGSDRGYAIDVCSDAGYIVSGRTTSFSEYNFEDMFLLKVELDGDTLWWKNYGGEYDDRAYSVAKTSDAGYIMAGFTEVDTTDPDIYIVKTDSDGVMEWQKTYRAPGLDTVFCIRQTADGGYVAVGYTTSFGAGKSDVYLLILDSLGDTIWTRTYGGTENDEGHGVLETSDGGYIIAGSSSSMGGSWDEVYIVKIDGSGVVKWERIYGGLYGDRALCISSTSDGGYIVCGYTLSFGNGNSDIYLLKLDSVGDTVWTQTYGGTRDDVGCSVRQTADGGYIAAGYSASVGPADEDIYLIKTDEYGEMVWSRIYGGDKDDRSFQVHQTQDGGYIISGRTRSFGSLRCDIYLLKTDSLGSVGLAEPRTSYECPLDLSVSPNPFTGRTTLAYRLPESSSVKIAVYDALGRIRATITDELQNPGTHTLTWDGRDDGGEDLRAGVYFIRLVSSEFRKTARLVIVR
jgi:hypothetical protein